MYHIIGIMAAFMVLGILISKKVEFGIAMISATAILLLFVNPTAEGVGWLRDILLERETVNLVGIILLIGFMGFLYRDSRQIHRIIEELRNAVPDSRAVVAAIPAIFGLMPIPGGALVSAPMIDEEGNRLGMNGVDKAFVNWWFRHMWFSIYPLEVGLIFAATLTGVNLYMIALFNIPVFMVHLVVGIHFGLRGIKREEHPRKTADITNIIYDFLPIILALSLNILFSIPLMISLTIGVLLLLYQNRERYGFDEAGRVLMEGISRNLLLAAVGIMLFKGTIERSEALLPLIDILQGRVPLLLVVILGAFAMGLLLGHLPAAVGVGLPVLLPLLPVVNVQTVAMVFLFILLGYVISPIHLCIVLTLEYFKADMRRFYRRAAQSVAALIAMIFLWLLVTGTFSLFL